MKSVVILGAGLIGKTIAADLSNRYRVVCADINSAALAALKAMANVETTEIDFTDKNALRALIAPHDLVIGAVPGFMGFEVLETVIKAGKNVVDISFFPEDPFLLDQLAKQNNVTAVVDCGIAPGMCNVFAGHHYEKTKVTDYECLVGGLPVVRELPFEYKAGFSPADVIEEYTRPVFYVQDGKKIEVEALSELETVFFNGIGDLESFCTDGLRSLTTTMPDVKNLKEKTLRYPGHAHLMKIFRETGLFSKESIKVRGKDVVPLYVTSKLLFEKWEMKPEDEDFTVMRVTIGADDQTYVYTLVDRYDRKTRTSSMARSTGYTCASAATLVLENKFNRKGICPPEFLGADETCFKSMLQYLSDRNVNFDMTCTNKTKTVNA